MWAVTPVRSDISAIDSVVARLRHTGVLPAQPVERLVSRRRRGSERHGNDGRSSSALEVDILPRESYAFGDGRVESVGSAWPGHPASTPAIASCSACVTHSRYFAFTATCRAT